MSIGVFGLAFLAGVLSILSPCVLPLLPIVFGAAASEHRAGPLALASGVVLSFVSIGLFVGVIGYAIGLDNDVFRNAGALLMMLVGGVLFAPALQVRLATAGGPISDWADRRISSIQTRGLAMQFGVGFLLGAVWSPCAGPTLGVAIALATQGRSLVHVGATMLFFGAGAAAPLLGLGLISRQMLSRWRERLLSGGKAAKAALGAVLILVGLLIVSGLDKKLEAALVAASPAWLTTLTTTF
jgi:cytochrome c biogenesis protein CcdA